MNVRVGFVPLRSMTRSITLPLATSTTLTLTEVAEKLARSAIAGNQGEREIRLDLLAVVFFCAVPALQRVPEGLSAFERTSSLPVVSIARNLQMRSSKAGEVGNLCGLSK